MTLLIVCRPFLFKPDLVFLSLAETTCVAKRNGP